MLNFIKKLYWAIVNWNCKVLMLAAWKKGKVSVYPNIKWFGDNKPVTSEQLAPELDAQDALFFKSGDLSICLIHGNPDGSFKMSENTMKNIYGHWIFVSCYNGNRNDIIRQNLWLQREPNTISNTSIAMMVINGDLYLSTEKSVVKQFERTEIARRWMEK